MLMPAAVLVLFLLASLALDTAVVWLGQRELANAAAAAANDAAAVGLDEAAFYRSGQVRLDPDRAVRLVADHAALAGDAPLRGVAIDRIAVDGTTIEVTLSARVEAVIGLPGRAGERTVRASAVATARS